MRAHCPYSSIIVGRDGKVVEWQDGGWTGSCTIGCAAVHRVMIRRHAHVGARHRASDRRRRKSWTRAARKRQRDQYDPEDPCHAFKDGHCRSTCQRPFTCDHEVPGLRRDCCGVKERGGALYSAVAKKLWAALDLPTMVSPINLFCAAVIRLLRGTKSQLRGT